MIPFVYLRFENKSVMDYGIYINKRKKIFIDVYLNSMGYYLEVRISKIANLKCMHIYVYFIKKNCFPCSPFSTLNLAQMVLSHS